MNDERARDEYLDRLSAACGMRTAWNETHLGCRYCALLRGFYDAQSRELNGIAGSLDLFWRAMDAKYGAKK